MKSKFLSFLSIILIKFSYSQQDPQIAFTRVIKEIKTEAYTSNQPRTKNQPLGSITYFPESCTLNNPIIQETHENARIPLLKHAVEKMKQCGCINVSGHFLEGSETKKLFENLGAQTISTHCHGSEMKLDMSQKDLSFPKKDAPEIKLDIVYAEEKIYAESFGQIEYGYSKYHHEPCRLYRLYTETFSRRSGVGSKLFQEMIKNLKQFDCERVQWNTFPMGEKPLSLNDLVKFYKKNGGQVDHRDVDKVHMSYSLKK